MKKIIIFFMIILSISLQAKDKLPPLKEGAPLPHDLFIKLAKIVNPAVVNISTSTVARFRGRSQHGNDPLFQLFEQYMRPGLREQRPMQSLGTGFIIRKDGLIVTNNHVIDKADVIQVQLSEGDDTFYEAEVIGKDARTDIALIKINPKGKKLQVAKLGQSSKLQVGEWVAAFGNPFGHGHSVTKGIISAIGREINGLNLFPFIQTDASINPGNSGGPLVNTKGEVIAVNTAIDARAQGIGFAIPIDNVKSLLPQLEKDGSIKRGFIGIAMADLDEASAKYMDLSTTKGALVTQVLDDSPADKAGIKPYDLVIKFNNEKVENTLDLSNAVARAKINQKSKIEILREGKAKTLTVRIGSPPRENQKVSRKAKSYKGQKAPFAMGFFISDWSTALAKEYQIPKLRQKHPIIIGVKRGTPASRAGLAPGDVILDINRRPVKRARDVLKGLRSDRINILRLLKGNRVVLAYLKPE